MSDIETGDAEPVLNNPPQQQVRFTTNDAAAEEEAEDSSFRFTAGSNGKQQGRQRRPPPPMRNLYRAKSQRTVVNKGGNFVVSSRNKRLDMEAGKMGVIVECMIENVTSQDTTPQNPTQRLWNKTCRAACCCSRNKSSGGADDDSLEGRVPQYRLRSSRKYKIMDRLRNLSGADDDDEDLYKSSWTVTGLITTYLNWTFRVSFWTLFIQFAITFWAITVIWALFIWAAADHQPICMQVAGVDVSQLNRHAFVDAYSLSWTTFSTVGYGVVYPQISTTALEHGKQQCFGMNFLVQFEVFVGILYVAMCGATIFGKIAVVQSYANVQFSDPLVIKYGTALLLSDKGDGDEPDGGEESTKNELPFPVLEFRIVNNQHGGRGEIINAKVKCIAVIKESKASDAMLIAAGVKSDTTQHMDEATIQQEMSSALSSPKVMARVGIDGLNYLKTNLTKALPTFKSLPLRKGIKTPRILPTARRLSTISEAKARVVSDQTISEVEASAVSDQRNVLHEGLFLATGKRRPAIIDEGSDLVPRRIYSEVELTNDSHPSFKRVWTHHHVLNEQSPLLRGKARKMIADNGGKWPEELNSYDRIRESIYFDDLVVTINGTSNATGANVYARKVYNFSNVNIGYSFATMLYVNRQGALAVDGHLLNDVVEQRGGGGEPFGSLKSNVMHQAVDSITTAAMHTYEQAGDVAGTVKDEIDTVAEHIKDGLHALADRARLTSHFESQEECKEDDSEEDEAAVDKKST